MLTQSHRLTSGTAFAEAVRRGRRAGTGSLVLHLAVPAHDADDTPVRVGFVVSKAVGSAVTRNLVKRRLRSLARERLGSLPGAAMLVVRALPAAASTSYATLAADFDSALDRLLRRTAGTGGLPR
ncbi:MAG TPA: ribonuclease P protein component [Nocardioidaceae bacterium]|nr:ribonuclease P protein component [Nocardioidaceae bacterium]